MIVTIVGTGPAGLGARIKVPRHPYCRQSTEREFTSELVIDVECVEEASLLGVFIILVVLVLIPVRVCAIIPASASVCNLPAHCIHAVLCPQTAVAGAKYFMQFSEYKKKVALGYTWDGKGNEIAPAGMEKPSRDSDVMDVESKGGGQMEETDNPMVSEGTVDEYEMET